MDWKKLGKTLLFPPIAFLFLLLVSAIPLMLYGMLVLGNEHPLTIASYVLAFYTLTIWCVRVPEIIRFAKTFKEENRYMKCWFSDVRLRTNVTLSGNVVWNGAYAALQLGLGVYHKSAWFYSLALYYSSLAIMRFFLVRYTTQHKPGEKMREEWHRYRTCGWVFLVLNMALTVMIFYMVYRNRIVRHHEITTIAMAAYTFTSLTMAILNVIKYRKYNSPAFSASKAISLASACVSMLTLEGTMLATFGTDMERGTQPLFLGLSGVAISAFVLVMAIYLIVHGNKEIKCMENEYGK